MYRTISHTLPARRPAALAGATAALAAGALALAPAVQAAPAHGTAPAGASTAVVLRAGLDVSLLNTSVDVPVNVSLNDVKAPASARKTALTVNVGHGVEGGRGVGLLRAEAATADATADRRGAEGHAQAAGAEVHLPGLPLLSLVKVDAVSSDAVCRVGQRPTASSHLAGVTVLGRRIDVSAVGTTKVAVPGVGEVDLALTATSTSSRTAAATALRLKVAVNPLSLGVAKVTGDVTLVQATCHTPGSGSGGSGGSTSGSGNGGASGGGSSSGSTSGSSSGSTSGSSAGSSAGSSSGSSAGSSSGASAGSASGGSGSGGAVAQPVTDSSGTGDLAETGSSSATPYIAVGAVALVAAGALAFVAAGRRRRSAAAAADDEV